MADASGGGDERAVVRAFYAVVARDGSAESAQAAAWGYDDAFLRRLELDAAATRAAFRAACGGGCPLRVDSDTALPRPGETVIDLGCGAGLDAVVASRLVGAQVRLRPTPSHLPQP